MIRRYARTKIRWNRANLILGLHRRRSAAARNNRGATHLQRAAPRRARGTPSRLMRLKAAQRSVSKLCGRNSVCVRPDASGPESLFLFGAKPSFQVKAERRDGSLLDAEDVHGFNEHLALDSGS